MTVLNGRETSNKIKEEIAVEVASIIKDGGKRPHLAAILVGEDGASRTYVNAKVKACEKVGFESTLIRLSAETNQEELLTEVNKLNADDSIDGFIVQLPLPAHIDEQAVIEAIDSKKDVDGFHPSNVGRMTLGLPCFLPATPFGILQLLSRYEVETSGKHCVVVGRSHIVGSPMSILLSQNNYPGNCTVTIAHSRTQNLKELCASADILVVALGKPKFITADMVKDGAVVVDVGITRVDALGTVSGYKLYGDVDYENVSSKCSFITPVPGGVGPITIVSLLKNTLKAAHPKRSMVV